MRSDLAKELVMNQHAETPMTFGDFEGDFEQDQTLPPQDAAEELEWLMSLALDNALDKSEAARLDLLLAQEPEHVERWAAWQALDSKFEQMPAVLPPVDFGAKFEQRLAIWERRRRLRTGILFGLAAVALWGSALGGTVILGALMWTNQGAWSGTLVHNFAYWWSAMGQFGQALVDTGEALWAAPQARAIFVCYVMAAMGILTAWFVFLRRSMRTMPFVEA
jgi:anti-sigma factor RsiW